MKSNDINALKILNMSWNELLYDPESDYYLVDKYNNFNMPWSKKGIVSPRWLLNASWDEVLNYNPKKYHVDDKVLEILNMDINDLIKR